MNEQELADLFSAQIDRILGGESAPAVAAEGDLPLLSLGQQLAQLNFQASPTAQAAFQNQLASWSGTPGGSLSATGFTFTKILLLSVGAIALIGAGLGLVVLISYTWTGAFFTPTTEDYPPVPAVTQPAPSNNPVIPSPAPATPTATQPPATSSFRDVLPAATNSVGDTLSRPASTSTPAATVLPAGDTPVPGPAGNGDDQEGDTPPGDHDRGHGNDPDLHDDDNPGQSQGPSGSDSGSGNPGDGSNQSGGQGGGGSGNNGNNSGNKGDKK